MSMNNMNTGYSTVDPELEKIARKNELEIQKQMAIADIKQRSDAQREWNRICAKEIRKENDLAQHEELIVDKKGEIYCITQNLNIHAEKRQVFNFKVVDMIRVMSVEGDSGIWVFKFIVDGIERGCVLEEKSIFDVKYVTRKLGCCGGMIYANSPKRKREYIEQLMSQLIDSCTETLILMTHLGWTKKKDGTFIFMEEEEKLWKNFLKRAK